MNANLVPRRDLAVIDTEAALAAVGNPVRRRLLTALAESPDSASGLADRLDDSRQRVNYHLKALESAGLVELAEERPRRGLTERMFRPVSRRFALDPSILGSLDAGGSVPEGDRWAAAYTIALVSRTLREVVALRGKSAEQQKRLAVAALDTTVRLGDPAAMESFIDELARAIAEVVARHDDPGAGSRSFRVTACSHPAPVSGSGDREE